MLAESAASNSTDHKLEMQEMFKNNNHDKAKLQRLQRESFGNRRKWLSLLKDAAVTTTIQQYPILGDIEYVRCTTTSVMYT